MLSQAGHSGRWYSGNLYAALKHGYLDGIDPTEIDLDAPCTREQMVTILYNVAGRPATNTSALAQFNDRGQVAAYASMASLGPCPTRWSAAPVARL